MLRSFPRKRESRSFFPWPWVSAFAGTSGTCFQQFANKNHRETIHVIASHAVYDTARRLGAAAWHRYAARRYAERHQGGQEDPHLDRSDELALRADRRQAAAVGLRCRHRQATG